MVKMLLSFGQGQFYWDFKASLTYLELHCHVEISSIFQNYNRQVKVYLMES